VHLDDGALMRFSVYLALLQQWERSISPPPQPEEAIVYHLSTRFRGSYPRWFGRMSRRRPWARAGLPSLPLFRPSRPSSGARRECSQESLSPRSSAQQCDDVSVVWGRGEQLGVSPEHHHAFDWAVSRALGPAADVARLALPFLAPGGRVLLYKGGPGAEELRSLDAFCEEHRAVRDLRLVSVPGLRGARSLITIKFPDTIMWAENAGPHPGPASAPVVGVL
jgi:hypothetical protein